MSTDTQTTRPLRPGLDPAHLPAAARGGTVRWPAVIGFGLATLGAILTGWGVVGPC